MTIFVIILQCDKVVELGLHTGKIINVVLVLFLTSIFFSPHGGCNSDVVHHRSEEGCRAERIREEASAICLYVQRMYLNMNPGALREIILSMLE